MAKTFNFDDFQAHSGSAQQVNCMACEELFTDALDELLSPADQLFFDQHLRGCTSCMEAFSQAKRGTAWLDLLKRTRPEPTGELMGRILAKTSGSLAPQTGVRGEMMPGELLGGEMSGAMPAAMLGGAMPVLPGKLLPFVQRPVQASRFTRMTRIAMEPRLAMTAAMAFFSIALTMNLLGVRLDQVHAEDLKPSGLKRTYYEATASGHRYYDNLRVVRVLESRVDDLRQGAQDDLRRSGKDDRRDLPGAATPAPRSKPEASPQQPEGPKPEANPASPHGSSRREAPMPTVPGVLNSSYQVVPEVRRTATGDLFAREFRLKVTGGLV